jgi:hypothetical protein
VRMPRGCGTTPDECEVADGAARAHSVSPHSTDADVNARTRSVCLYAPLVHSYSNVRRRYECRVCLPLSASASASDFPLCERIRRRAQRNTSEEHSFERRGTTTDALKYAVAPIYRAHITGALLDCASRISPALECTAAGLDRDAIGGARAAMFDARCMRARTRGGIISIHRECTCSEAQQ